MYRPRRGLMEEVHKPVIHDSRSWLRECRPLRGLKRTVELFRMNRPLLVDLTSMEAVCIRAR